jgi:hypothetical protein
MEYAVQSATLDRLFNLPESFFRDYDSADLGQRAMSISTIYTIIAQNGISSVLAALFSLFYLWRMYKYSALMTIWGLVMLLIVDVFVFQPLVLLIAVAVLFGGAETDGVPGAEPIVIVGEGVVIFGARDDGDGTFRCKIFVIVDPVIGNSQKIIAVFVVLTDHIFGGVFSVGTGGVAVKASLQQSLLAIKSLLANFHDTKSFLLCFQDSSASGTATSSLCLN